LRRSGGRKEVGTVDGELLRVRDLAQRLGVSRRVAYELVARGVVPGVVRAGRALYIRRRVLEAWLGGGGTAAAVGEKRVIGLGRHPEAGVKEATGGRPAAGDETTEGKGTP
jgi:excisionase family DNA binding protein